MGYRSGGSAKALRIGLLVMCATAVGWRPVTVEAQAQAQAQAQAADAQDAEDSGQLQEIVVTATRQPQTIDTVPVSIAAYTQQTLTDLDVQTIDDLTRITPGITLSRNPFGNGDQSNISIRGISSSVGAATTAIYIDDTPVEVRNEGVTATNPYPAVFDLDRVEVLRGPQGTLFGADAEGGAVRFITPTPSLTDYNLYARSEVSSIDGGGNNYEGGVAYGGPIIDNELGFRVSGWARQDGGYIDRIDYFTGDDEASNSNYKDSGVFHGTLRWEPATNLTITPSLYYQTSHLNDSNVYWEPFSAGGQYASAALGPQPAVDSFWLPSVKVEWGGDFVHVISNSSYFTRDDHGVSDYTTADNTLIGSGVAPAFSYFPLPGESEASGQYTNLQTSWTQEIRVQAPDPTAQLNWVTGLYVHRESLNAREYIEDPNTDIIATYGYGVPTTGASLLGPLLPGSGIFESNETDIDKQYAAFAQMDYELLPKLRATVGARVSRYEYEFNVEEAGPIAGGPASGSDSGTPVTPHYGVSYQADDHDLLYVSAGKGFRPGGGNSPVPMPLCASSLALFGLSNTPSTYNPDSDWSYEIGAKDQLFDGWLQSEISGYHIDWRNIETQIQLNCGFSVNLNLGTAVSNGFDMTERFRVTEGLVLGLALGYDDAHYTKTIQTGVLASGLPALAVASGDSLGAAPWTGSATGDYHFNVLGQRSFIHLDYQYTSEGDQPDPRVATYDPGYPRSPDVSVLNARAGFLINRVEWAVFATNLTDSAPELEREHDALGDPLYRGMTIRPRTVGLQVNIRY